MRQLPRKKSESKCTERDEEDFNDLKKLITETSRLAQFATDRDITVTTDGSRTGLRKISWQ